MQCVSYPGSAENEEHLMDFGGGDLSQDEQCLHWNANRDRRAYCRSSDLSPGVLHHCGETDNKRFAACVINSLSSA